MLDADAAPPASATSTSAKGRCATTATPDLAASPRASAIHAARPRDGFRRTIRQRPPPQPLRRRTGEIFACLSRSPILPEGIRPRMRALRACPRERSKPCPSGDLPAASSAGRSALLALRSEALNSIDSNQAWLSAAISQPTRIDAVIAPQAAFARTSSRLGSAPSVEGARPSSAGRSLPSTADRAWASVSASRARPQRHAIDDSPALEDHRRALAGLASVTRRQRRMPPGRVSAERVGARIMERHGAAAERPAIVDAAAPIGAAPRTRRNAYPAQARRSSDIGCARRGGRSRIIVTGYLRAACAASSRFF